MSPVTWHRGGRGARPVGDIIRSLLRRKKFHEKRKYGPLVDAWSQLVGETIACRTHIGAFAEGELTVEVDSATLLHELNGFMKQHLLAGLQATRPGRDVAMLRFCLVSQTDGMQSETS